MKFMYGVIKIGNSVYSHISKLGRHKHFSYEKSISFTFRIFWAYQTRLQER